MSYIVPREKPKCYNCPFRTLDYCGLLIEHDCVTVNVNEMTVSKYCPLVEIPTPHGDLVDLNDMVHPNDSMKRMTIDEQLRRTCEGWSIDRKQYVVIEAEGSEE